MDLDAFKKQLAASRQVEIKIDGVTFRLELPSEYVFRTAMEENLDRHGRILNAKVSREVLLSAITGWDGVKTTHILPGTPEELIPFSRDSLAMLLDANQSFANELTNGLHEKWTERREKLEAARKN